MKLHKPGWYGAWLAVGFLITGATLGLAEEVVLTTYFPSPRGVYEELRTALMRFNDASAPPKVMWQWRLNTADTTLRLQRTDVTGAVIAEHLTVSNAGNIGIGTTTPTAKLHLVRPSGSTTPVLRLEARSGDPTPFFISDTGVVGIGTTTPAMRLTVVAAAPAGGGTDGILIQGPAAPSLNIQQPSGRELAQLGGVTTAGNFASGSAPGDAVLRSVFGRLILATGTSGTNSFPRVTVTNAGDVGVGTTTPTAKLHIVQTGTQPTIRIEDQSGDTSPLAITDTGSIGIGTATPVGKLDITGGDVNLIVPSGLRGFYVYEDSVAPANMRADIRYDKSSDVAGVGVFYTDTGKPAGVMVSGTEAVGATIHMCRGLSQSDDPAITNCTFPGGPAGDIVFLVDADGNTTVQGNLGVGTTAPPAARLQVMGDIRIGIASGTTGCLQRYDGGVIIGTCSSDLQLKQQIAPLAGALGKIAQLRPVSFRWRAKEYPDLHFGDGVNVGLIAQDVEAVIPQWVGTDEQGFKTVNYGAEMEVWTLAAVKELKAEHDALKARVAQLQSALDALTRQQASNQDAP